MGSPGGTSFGHALEGNDAEVSAALESVRDVVCLASQIKKRGQRLLGRYIEGATSGPVDDDRGTLGCICPHIPEHVATIADKAVARDRDTPEGVRDVGEGGKGTTQFIRAEFIAMSPTCPGAPTCGGTAVSNQLPAVLLAQSAEIQRNKGNLISPVLVDIDESRSAIEDFT
ncbi:hypothetical protein BCR41DRAFT_396822 [Lobosporangium transversale]|uniref:Uncharacterized protein n=1 Tax=Lobosporangium transversale TaxID=64571 RepID=A0A1Y2GNE8_9FUNG|nr:hypothetical protein BCR41DRAFT_396822 [Lobosporangium transversale]ORZ14336.1 hypothetical protein BCR41DRAFT_396822 [Lobosporangium transversale]|eukprot:XP_021880814.1 hypothetical protein BCR41DRAFT_396822 [Lobosporangium transversale]